MVVVNSPYVYHKSHWVQSLTELLDRPLSSFDAVVMGRINGVNKRSSFGKDLLKLSKKHPEYFDSHFTKPTIERLAETYDGPIVALPMFAVYGQDVKVDAQLVRDASENRSNIYTVETRRHIQAIGNECGTDSLHAIGTCMHTVKDNKGGRDPRDMHRCAGDGGGHADLVAWDVIEQLYEILA